MSLHFISFHFMFLFEVYRPPTKSVKKAAAHMSQTTNYLFSSTDPTPAYLKTGLAMVNETALLWKLATGNSTSSYGHIASGEEYCEMFQTVLSWLTGHLNADSLNDNQSEISNESDDWDEEDQTKYYLSEAIQNGGRLSVLVRECLAGRSEKSQTAVKTSSTAQIITP
jgi:hypothetical protein